MARKNTNKGGGKKAPKPKTTSRKSNIGKTLGSLAKHMLPILGKGLLAALPFPTSGAMAAATPMPVMQNTQVSAPIANGFTGRSGKARMVSNPNGMKVVHREYVSDIIHLDPTGGFEILQNQPINPTNGQLFPWLAGIASRFETYKFKSLRFIYEPQNSTTSIGTVMLVVDYDASDLPPVDKTQMMSYKGAVRSPAWFACVNVSASSDLNKRMSYYIRNNSQDGEQDPKLYNVGNLYVAFQGDTPAYTAGELYVEYEIDLSTPVLKDSIASTVINFTDGEGVNVVAGDNALQAAHTTKGALGVLFEYVADDNQSYLLFPVAGHYLIDFSASFGIPTPSGQDFLNLTLANESGDGYRARQINIINYPATTGFPQCASVITWEIQVNNTDTLVPINLLSNDYVGSVRLNNAMDGVSCNTYISISQIQSGQWNQGLTEAMSLSTSVRISRASRLMNERKARRRDDFPVGRNVLKTASENVPNSRDLHSEFSSKLETLQKESDKLKLFMKFASMVLLDEKEEEQPPLTPVLLKK